MSCAHLLRDTVVEVAIYVVMPWLSRYAMAMPSECCVTHVANGLSSSACTATGFYRLRQMNRMKTSSFLRFMFVSLIILVVWAIGEPPGPLPSVHGFDVLFIWFAAGQEVVREW